MEIQMENWKLSLVNSSELTIRAKKKDLFKSEKKYLAAKVVENDHEEEVFINRQSIVWIKRISDTNQEKN